ncbi:uncharacterized protein LOC112090774 [Morus notabilis]|uniref:uncharacterized protein LOC112090774 n=1 Tax=Morus notabilis TaxID=981085 RepID=UPI000CED2349|nr:uncharacterized protein LOC112090774 [Morus notabilis]
MDNPSDAIVETRQDLMVSPTEHDFRTAHFLKPSAPPTTSVEEAEAPPFFDSSTTKTSKPRNRNSPLEVSFDGWLFPQEEWKNWVEKLSPKYKQTWERAGIYRAIMGSTYKVIKCPDLVLELAKKWSPKTNTFVFDFAETTITLEDIMLCGGYSVLGCPVFNPLEASFLRPSEREEMEEKEQKLNEERLVLTKSKAKKPCHYPWMRIFMEEKERKSEIEHEAFLSLWLSRFVFPACSRTVILKHLFPLAIRLARGTRIALAPAVLASIYRDLSLLREKMFASIDSNHGSKVVVWAPFQLVQVWVYERFVLLQPERNLGELGQTRLAQWHKVKKLECEDVKAVFNSSGEFFIWRPYAMEMENWVLPKFYRDKEEWLLVNEGLDEELESFALCLRASELVGIDQSGHFVEKYLPHRVARQFGMGQDLPGSVSWYNQTHFVAWKSYNKPMNFEKLYIQSRFFSPGVTYRYFEWWNRWKSGGQDAVGPMCGALSKRPKKESNTTSVPPSFPPKCNDVEVGGSHLDDKVTHEKMLGTVDAKRPKNGSCFSGSVIKKKRPMEPVEEKGAVDNKRKRLREETGDSSCHLVFSQKSNKAKFRGSDPQGKSTLAEMLRPKHIDDGNIPQKEGPSSNVVKETMEKRASMEDKRKRLREENDLSCPPGFSQKHNGKVEVRGSDPEDRSTFTQMFRSRNIIGRSVNGNPSPIRKPFEKEASKEEKVDIGGSDVEDRLTLTRMVKSKNIYRSVNGSPLPMTEPVEEEAALKDKKSEVVSEEERLNDKKGESGELCEFNLDGVDALEARIARAENSIANIKAARRHKMLFGTRKTKEKPGVLEELSGSGGFFK